VAAVALSAAEARGRGVVKYDALSVPDDKERRLSETEFKTRKI
jgi:hypothetical protein